MNVLKHFFGIRYCRECGRPLSRDPQAGGKVFCVKPPDPYEDGLCLRCKMNCKKEKSSLNKKWF